MYSVTASRLTLQVVPSYPVGGDVTFGQQTQMVILLGSGLRGAVNSAVL